MQFQRWRWWQWLVVSLIVGGVLGFVLSRQDMDDPSIPSLSVGEFLRKLQIRTDNGDSVLTDIRVSPPLPDVHGKVMRAVTFWEKQKRKSDGVWLPVREWRMYAMTPFYPRAPRADYSILDFLADKKKDIPSLDFAIRWWQVPGNMYLLCIGGSVLLIGVLWPLTMRGLVAAGLGAPENETETTDLSHVQTTSGDIPTHLKTGVSAADRDKLAVLNAELAANVAGMTVTAAAPDETPTAQQEQAIRDLPNAPLEAAAIDAKAKPSEEDYKGEYYPVARPIVKKA